MGVKNTLTVCAKNMGNTGIGDCWNDFGYPVGIIFTPRNKTFSTASITALKSALAATIVADVPVNRSYPIQNIVNITDNSEDDTTETFATTGAMRRVREGYYNLSFQWVNGGFCLLHAIRKGNGLRLPFFIITNKGYLLGTDAGQDLMKGLNLADAWAPKFTWPTAGSTGTAYSLSLVFEPSQLIDSPAFVDFSNAGGLGYLTGLSGLQDIRLDKISRSVNVLSVGASTSCGSVNLYDLYATELASASLWRAYADNAGVPGNALDITSVASSPNVKGFNVTITTSDPDYVAGAPIWVSLAPVSALSAAGVVGFESNTVSIAV